MAACLYLTGCALPPPESDEVYAQRRAEYLQVVAAENAEARPRLEAALAEGGGPAATYTIRYRNGVRVIVRDFDLLLDRYCATAVATRGTQNYNDRWRPLQPPQRRCTPYRAIDRIDRGDARD
jgi:hypothetical protein